MRVTASSPGIHENKEETMTISLIRNTLLATFLLLALTVSPVRASTPDETVTPQSRCAVCGMFVAKYRNWLTGIRFADGTEKYFDGVKDMMAFYFSPEKYGGPGRDQIKDIQVRDYYTMQWIDGRKAYYVIGSDVMGPMGKELIPFTGRKAAESFLKDHKGREILAFDQLTDALIQSMRSGMKMMKMNMKMQN